MFPYFHHSLIPPYWMPGSNYQVPNFFYNSQQNNSCFPNSFNSTAPNVFPSNLTFQQEDIPKNMNFSTLDIKDPQEEVRVEQGNEQELEVEPEVERSKSRGRNLANRPKNYITERRFYLTCEPIKNQNEKLFSDHPRAAKRRCLKKIERSFRKIKKTDQKCLEAKKMKRMLKKEVSRQESIAMLTRQKFVGRYLPKEAIISIEKYFESDLTGWKNLKKEALLLRKIDS